MHSTITIGLAVHWGISRNDQDKQTGVSWKSYQAGQNGACQYSSTTEKGHDDLCPYPVVWIFSGAYSPSFSKNRQIDSIPRWKFGMWNFSLGVCRLSSVKPKPIITLGIFNTSWKSVTIGIEPPERINTVSFLKISRMASVEAFTYLLSVPTTHAGPLLQTLILVSIPLGVSFFTYAV